MTSKTDAPRLGLRNVACVVHRRAVMALRCESCGNYAFRLRRAEGGAEAECISCGRVIPNSVLRAATRSPMRGDSPEKDEDA